MHRWVINRSVAERASLLTGNTSPDVVLFDHGCLTNPMAGWFECDLPGSERTLLNINDEEGYNDMQEMTAKNRVPGGDIVMKLLTPADALARLMQKSCAQ
jgi:hypothetical protein